MTMTMTEMELEIERAGAKARLREIQSTLAQLRALTSQYNTAHDKWRRRYEAADRKIAEEEKLTKVPAGVKKPTVMLTQEQVEELAKQLCFDLDEINS